MEKLSKVHGVLLLFILLHLVTGCNKPLTATSTQQASRDLVLEQTIETQLEGMNPAALPIYRETTKALDAGEVIPQRGGIAARNNGRDHQASTITG